MLNCPIITAVSSENGFPGGWVYVENALKNAMG